ncbi:DUF2383 domain-containing protein [Caldisalinibacter kiritimatiensis]|uniref:DUF2383 domain-containing protein n=1 Tax=Caldisalinibacter kiritimatiensis TaxID=1304284 RepID=R1CSB6_9FIRM|nr:DUF2383 domain-containing protein [Caldisalinibacter kiritimatiensis]EOC99598.1 hypothetical protein L21TH_2371 [Caldisalinibacter kiritimatiensis]
MGEKEKILDSLNNLLQGEYMAIEGYNIFINHIDDPRLKNEFQNIQQDHRRHAALLAERIQNYDDMPREKTGFKGAMADTMLKMDLSVRDDAPHILRKAYEGEGKGIKMAEEVVRGDLDSESRELVGEILSEDRKHLDRMRKLMEEY